MKFLNKVFKIIFFIIILMISKVLTQSAERTLVRCKTTQYFSITDLDCKDCHTSAEQDPSGYSCKCKANSRYILNKGGELVQCISCAANEVVSDDGWTCIPCNGCDKCSSNTFSLRRSLLGTPTEANCSACAGLYTYNSASLSCQLCSNYLLAGSINCTCPGGTTPGASNSCFLSSANADNTLPYVDGTQSVTSAYLQENMLAAIALCQNKVKSGCQSIANMCVMQYYNDLTANNACKNYLAHITSLRGFGWPADFPWLFYTVPLDLNNMRLPKQFSRNDMLSIVLGTYNLTGHFLGYRNASDGRGYMQLCSNSQQRRSQAFRFGTYYQETCTVNLNDLFNKDLNVPVFYEPFITYEKADGQTYYFPIPVKIGQVKSKSGTEPNKAFVQDSWIFTRRFMMVDNVGSIINGFQLNKTSEFVTIAHGIRIVVTKDTSTPFDINTDGKILCPYIEINLTSIARTTSTNNTVVTFEVVYRNPSEITNQIAYSLSVAMGVLCALAGMYAILRTFFWSRRSGCDRFEWIALIKCLSYACCTISNTFFLVIFGFSLYYLLLYKNQQLFSVFPPDNDSFFIAYQISAFILKFLEIIHIIVMQCTVDIFLIDWERPRNLHAPKNVIERSKFDQSQDRSGDQPNPATNLQQDNPEHNLDNNVSIWRTYFIANEWNEIQVYRKTSLVFNLMVVLLFMEVVGFGHATTYDPFSILNPTQDHYKAPYNRIFRFSMIVLIFGITGFVQWLFTILFYERLIDDKLRNYVDLCSVSNVSVLVLQHRQFGFYIHGRSVHGCADVSLTRMYQALRKENEGTCAKRGLETDSDQQTYIVALPNDFRKSFDPIYNPYSSVMNNSHSSGSGKQPSIEENRTRQYLEVNKFLDRLINRTNNPRINYVFQDRKLFEDIFDGEFEDHSLMGRFYRDNGMSFGNVLYYGNELSLITFDMLLFTIVDLFMQNTVLDAIITWAIVVILNMIRKGCGSYNLAKKTMVDRRFLI